MAEPGTPAARASAFSPSSQLSKLPEVRHGTPAAAAGAGARPQARPKARLKARQAESPAAAATRAARRPMPPTGFRPASFRPAMPSSVARS